MNRRIENKIDVDVNKKSSYLIGFKRRMLKKFMRQDKLIQFILIITNILFMMIVLRVFHQEK